MSAVRIPLELNSLYISTVPLLGDTFHWAFIHVDSLGVHTRHHWAAATLDVTGPETYIENELPSGALSKTRNNKVLGYFKIVGYKPVEISTLRHLCQQVFPTSYMTVAENRHHAITCRTWVLHIIGRLISEERALEVERQVKARSTAQSNEYANSFLWQRPFMCIAEDV
ncbi:hypothetical protein BDW22DRAFT_704869 [Trametopsis cervina]|nr:hypothetical protein BDW22DRAFT_704869 [Trametopsis cervina]